MRYRFLTDRIESGTLGQFRLTKTKPNESGLGVGSTIRNKKFESCLTLKVEGLKDALVSNVFDLCAVC